MIACLLKTVVNIRNFSHPKAYHYKTFKIMIDIFVIEVTIIIICLIE